MKKVITYLGSLSQSQKFRVAMVVFFSIAIGITLFYLNYSDLSWSNNKTNYIGIISCMLLIFTNIMANREEKQLKQEKAK